MSKISLAPNASGTGTLTISAPNTNTDRAIALPDAAGTVFVSGQALSATTGSFSGDVTLGSSVLATPSGSAPSYTCRAWVNFNGTGTVAIRASGNVSSITDNGVGSYTANFTNSMPDANYCLSANGSYDISGSTPTNYTQLTLKQGSGYNTTSSCRINTIYSTGTGGGQNDFEYVNLAIFR